MSRLGRANPAQLAGRGRRRGVRRGARDERYGRECERSRGADRTMKQPASHDAARRTLCASNLGTDGEVARRSSNQELGGGALGNEADSGLQTAGVLLELDVLVVMDGDLVLGTEEARGGESRHRTLRGHHETLAASDEPAGETT